MKFSALNERNSFLPAIGGLLVALCGLGLWSMPLGESWVNASYDYLFRFGARTVTNKVVLVLMDNAARQTLHQERPNWDRGLHAELLNKLARDGCPLAVFDVYFGSEQNPETDAALADAMRRNGRVALMAKVIDPAHPHLDIAQLLLPHKLFLQAATNWGIGAAGAQDLQTVRQHWPFPAPAGENFLSLPWKAAELAGARLPTKPEEQWLRYYGQRGSWEVFSYHLALSNSPAYFRDKIVFVGNEPQSSDPNFQEKDKFRTPYTRWTAPPQSSGGVEIMATSFLNLMNGDWLRRPPTWVEGLALVVTGLSIGWGLCQVRPLAACGLAAGTGLTVMFGAVCLSYFSNLWFPWLVVAGGQVPCALGWALLVKIARRPEADARGVTDVPSGDAPSVTAVLAPATDRPDAPDYELLEPPFGAGGFGKVWLARNAIGQWQALKAVFQAKFGEDHAPYDAEFKGIERYKPISDKHPGLLRVDFISRKKTEGYFYYVMELGDALEPGWEVNPATYRPRDLASVRNRTRGRRLPISECVSIGLTLADALSFLHGKGLTHRDIKPSNIIFVNGSPKLADVGLVGRIRPTEEPPSQVAGTIGYMPPDPNETPGTAQADVYGLGMVLYVISTGRDPVPSLDLPTSLVERTGEVDFMRLNSIIIKACHSDCAQRYARAADLHAALLELQQSLNRERTTQQV